MKKYLWIPAVAALAYFGKKGLDLKRLADQIQFRTTGVRLLTSTQGLTLRVFMEIQNPTPSPVKIRKISGSVLINKTIVGTFDLPNIELQAGYNKQTIDVRLDSAALATLGLTNLIGIFTGGLKLPDVTIKSNIHLGLISVSDSQTYKLA
jgi:hypothetical protein